MSNVYLSENLWFEVNPSKSALREDETYQSIRLEINRRSNPLAGNINWLKIRQSCEALGKQVGADLLVGIYYTTAAMKTQGLSGLANGLDLLAAILATQTDDYPPERRNELFQWLIGKIGDDIRMLRPDRPQLRELYRCERACQLIDSYSQRLGSTIELESIAFLIFEHIDRLEWRQLSPNAVSMATTSTTSSSAGPAKVYQHKKCAFVPWLVACFVVGLLIGIGGSYASFYQGKPKSTPLTDLASISSSQQIPEAIAIEQLRQQYSTAVLMQYQHPLIQHYEQYITRLQQMPIGEPLYQTRILVDQLQQLFPKDEKVKILKQNMEQWTTQKNDYLQKQYARFNRARTLAANMRVAVDKKDWQSVTRQAASLEAYAISLSPIYGRAFYIQDLINEKQWRAASQEQATLDLELQAIALKAREMAAQLQQVKSEGSGH